MENSTSMHVKLRLVGKGLPPIEAEHDVKNDEQNKMTTVEWLRRWLERNRTWLYQIMKDAGEESVASVYEDNVVTEVRLSPQKAAKDFSFLSGQNLNTQNNPSKKLLPPFHI